MSSFFAMDLERHLGRGTPLMKIHALLDWHRLARLLDGVHSRLGPSGYDTISMFKCLLLQAWHSFSDPALEESLRVRPDFLHFTGFELGANLPDETTFCRFRNKLVKSGQLETLFYEVNQQLEAKGLKVKKADVAIVDATLIHAGARPRKVVEVVDFTHENTIKYAADPDARWLKKGKKNHFGYQGFARGDVEGFIEKTHVTPANLPEVRELETMTQGVKKGVRVQGDKGFFSAANKEMLQKKGLKNGLMYKAFRNRPLSQRKKAFNKLISKTRFRIEQSFGTIKRRFNYRKATYFTTAKVHAEFMMKALCHNLLKAANKLEWA